MELTAPPSRFHASATSAAAVGKLASSGNGSAPASSKSPAATSPPNSDDPSHELLRSVDSTSSLSSTVYEDDEQQLQPPGAPHRPGSAPPNLAFESSAFFNFGGPSAFFAHMKYDDELPSDEFPEALASPPRNTNDDVLPPPTSLDATTSSRSSNSSSNSNSSTSTPASTSAVAVPTMAPTGFTGQPHRFSSSSSSTASGGSATNRSSHRQQQHRKNSIEMFLSQSPSQSLGGDFLKISLDDHALSLHASSDRTSGGNGGAANAFATGHFTLNAVPESPPKFGRTNSHVRLQAQQVVAQQQSTQQSDRYGTAGVGTTGTAIGALDVPPPLMSRSSSASSYSNYQLSPRMGSEDSWHSSQDGGGQSSSAAYYQEQDYYSSNSSSGQYSSNGGASGLEPLQQQHAYRHTHYPSQQQQQQQYHTGPQRQQQHDMYRSNPSLYGNGNGNSYGRNHHANGNQWNGPSSANSMYMSAQHQPQQQLHYQSNGSGSMRSTGGGRGHRNSHQHHDRYARGTPPLPEASPPHSPRKPLGLNSVPKPCKFFAQGHCRMGNKCKFAHHHVASSGSSGGSLYPYNHGSLQMSPLQPPHQSHHHSSSSSSSSHHLGLQDDGPLHAFGRQASRASGFRQSELSNSAFSSVLGGSGTNSAAGLATNGLGPTAAIDATALSVDDIRGRVFAMSKDQNGCRLLQEQLDFADRVDLCDVIYCEALEHLAEMMVDPFGNYLFQKLLERVGPLQRLAIVRRVSSHLVAAALNLHGTRSVQKVVEVCATSPQVVEDVDANEDDGEDDVVTTVGRPSSSVTTTDDSSDAPSNSHRQRTRTVHLPDMLVDALQDDAVRLCIDANGNHVIQRALQCLAPAANQFVFDAVCRECTTVGTHRHGCCVLQRCLDAANPQQKAAVIAQVERHAMKLMQDPYGNYVVQYVLDACAPAEALGVIVTPLGRIYELSVQKFSSNVIEKCLEKAPERIQQQYVDELIASPKMPKMLQDQFANYVVQRALCVCADAQCVALIDAIRPHLASMKNTSGGRRITARILKRFPAIDLSFESASSTSSGLSPTRDGMNGLYDLPPPQQSMRYHHHSHYGQQQQTSRLPPGAAMSYGTHHQQNQQPQYQQQQPYGMHSSGYALGLPQGMNLAYSSNNSSSNSSSNAGSYGTHQHHNYQHQHLPPTPSSGMGDERGLGAAGTSRA